MASKSSSSSETSSDEPYSVIIGEEEEIDDEHSLIAYADDDDDDLETEEDTDDYDVPEYINQFELRKPSNFFEKLGVYVPDIEELSEDITEDTKKKSVTQEAGESLEGDTGAFVDPLTGEDLRQTPPMKEEEEEIKEQEEIEEEEVEEEEESEWESDSELTFPDESEEVIVVAEQAAEEAFGAFLDMQVEKEEKLDEQIDFKKLIREREIERERKGVVDLLESLIDEAVRLAEFVSPEMLLRQNVDKRLLMREIYRVLNLLQYTKDQSTFLHRKCVDYFKRKKSYRSIVADNPKTVERAKIKLQENLNRLDILLKKEIDTRDKNSAAISNLQEELQQIKSKAEEEISVFEMFLRKSFLLENRPNLNKIIERLLKYMAQLRKEVNKARFKLIIRQHAKVNLIQRIAELENIADGLKLEDYKSMQSEIKILNEKINERDSEIEKYQKRLHFEIHQMSHLHERTRMLKNSVQSQRLGLKDLYDERDTLRKRMDTLRRERQSLRQQIRTLSLEEGGLIDKPLLLLDYKKCSERCEFLRGLIEGLRSRQDRLQNVISYIESNFFC